MTLSIDEDNAHSPERASSAPKRSSPIRVDSPERIIQNSDTQQDHALSSGFDLPVEFKIPVKKRPWSVEELDALTAGMTKYGARWSTILREYGEEGKGLIKGRSQVQLKDKARVEKNRRLKDGLPLHPYECASDRN